MRVCVPDKPEKSCVCVCVSQTSRRSRVEFSFKQNGKVDEGDKEAAKAVASSWDKDWGSDTLNCTSLALGSCVRGSLVVGAVVSE